MYYFFLLGCLLFFFFSHHRIPFWRVSCCRCLLPNIIESLQSHVFESHVSHCRPQHFYLTFSAFKFRKPDPKGLAFGRVGLCGTVIEAGRLARQTRLNPPVCISHRSPTVTGVPALIRSAGSWENKPVTVGLVNVWLSSPVTCRPCVLKACELQSDWG